MGTLGDGRSVLSVAMEYAGKLEQPRVEVEISIPGEACARWNPAPFAADGALSGDWNLQLYDEAGALQEVACAAQEAPDLPGGLHACGGRRGCALPFVSAACCKQLIFPKTSAASNQRKPRFLCNARLERGQVKRMLTTRRMRNTLTWSRDSGKENANSM